MSNINNLLEAIRKDFASNKFDKFIHEINFPKFKNFAPGVKLNLRFPVTVLVGPNGGGKSSVLHAAWGMPLRSSTSRFWFSTPVDPMDFDSENQNRYWYSHYVKELKQQVQCRKMCGNKRHGYWEPTRPAQKELMAEMPAQNDRNKKFMSRSADRWNQVERSPLYINSKAESSAFERFFYSLDATTLESKQDSFVKYSRQLKAAIDDDLKSLQYYGRERIKANHVISDDLLIVINKILKKNYKSARYVVHSLYERNFSPSVIFETDRRTYSECFAGSGELAVVNCVLALDKLKPFDLLLLDEPETSLHPGAQTMLLEHILTIVKEKMIQVIISSHSPTFVELLPVESLIVLDSGVDGIISRANPSKTSAFHTLGHVESSRLTIVTEDKLLEVMVERALKQLPKELARNVVVVGVEVGASEMLSNQIRAYAQADAKIIMVLDGDQSDIQQVIDLDPESLSITSTKQHISYLKDKKVSIVGTRQELGVWIKWCKKHLILIDQVCPEQLLLQLLAADHKLLTDKNATNQKFKEAVKRTLNKSGDDTDSKSQAAVFKFLLGRSEEGSDVHSEILALAEKLQGKIEAIKG